MVDGRAARLLELRDRARRLVDGILLHQGLQWRHMLTSEGSTPDRRASPSGLVSQPRPPPAGLAVPSRGGEGCRAEMPRGRRPSASAGPCSSPGARGGSRARRARRHVPEPPTSSLGCFPSGTAIRVRLAVGLQQQPRVITASLSWVARLARHHTRCPCSRYYPEGGHEPRTRLRRGLPC